MSKTAFVDTNLFIRLFTKDDPVQVKAVLTLLRQAHQKHVRLITSMLTIAELVWVLERVYRLSRLEIRKYILSITNTDGIQVEAEELVIQAVEWYVMKNIDFIDAYNIAWMLAQGIETAYTFDQRHFSRVDGLDVKVPGQSTS